MTVDERLALLGRYGRAYGANGIAVAFTQAISGDPEAKRCVTRGWETTVPLSTADLGAGYIGTRGKSKNPCIVLRPSGLIGLECDTPDDLARIEQLSLPATVTVRSSEEYKRHFYFRPPADLEGLPLVAFRFESGQVTGDVTRYFVCPPALHYSGRVYEFLPGLAIDEIEFATLPASVYRNLVLLARGSNEQTREHLQEDPAAKVLPGRRRDMLFRYACALRRWTADRDEIAQAVHAWNERHCEPPVDRCHVEIQVDGAMKKPGGQAFGGAV